MCWADIHTCVHTYTHTHTHTHAHMQTPHAHMHANIHTCTSSVWDCGLLCALQLCLVRCVWPLTRILPKTCASNPGKRTRQLKLINYFQSSEDFLSTELVLPVPSQQAYPLNPKPFHNYWWTYQSWHLPHLRLTEKGGGLPCFVSIVGSPKP